MNLFVIGGGKGSRLKQEGVVFPKPLVEIEGQSLLERVLEVTKNNKFDKIKILLNPELLAFKDRVSRIIDNIDSEVIVVYKTTQSSFHSFYELSKISSPESFILMTIDSVFKQEEFDEFYRCICSYDKYYSVIAITEFVRDEKPLWVETDNELNILAFKDTKTNEKLITGGIYYFNYQVFDFMEAAYNNRVIRLRNLLRFLLTNKVKMKGFIFSKIIDVDHIEDIELAREFLKTNFR
ncbi:MAG: sugar phosphate nucleotidyltransferase [Ignavibacteria bacterium]